MIMGMMRMMIVMVVVVVVMNDSFYYVRPGRKKDSACMYIRVHIWDFGERIKESC